MKKKLLVILFLIIIILNTNISFVMATGEECKLAFSYANSNSNVKLGDTVELILKVSDIKAEGGIAAINGLLVYDEEVFEEIVYEKSNDWYYWQIENVLFSITTNMESTTKDSEVLKIKLKIKSNAKPGEYVVKFTKIEATGDNGTCFSVDDVESKITLNTLEDNNKNEVAENDDNIITNTNNGFDKKENSTKTISTTNNLNNTISSKLLPKTGIKQGIIAIAIIIAVILLGIMFYKKYKV